MLWSACVLQDGLQANQSAHKWHLILICSRISLSCIQKCEHMILTFSMLNNIFLLHSKTQNYHLKFLNVLRQMPQYKYLFTLKKYFCVTNNIMLQLADMTLRNLQTSSMDLLQIMYMTLNTINGGVKVHGVFFVRACCKGHPSKIIVLSWQDVCTTPSLLFKRK